MNFFHNSFNTNQIANVISNYSAAKKAEEIFRLFFNAVHYSVFDKFSTRFLKLRETKFTRLPVAHILYLMEIMYRHDFIYGQLFIWKHVFNTEWNESRF